MKTTIAELEKRVKKLEDKISEKTTYSVGDRFEHNNREYILAYVGDYKVCLIDLSNGKFWECPWEVDDYTSIAEHEWVCITGSAYFYKIS